jgi:dienelactone hydrolase
LERPDTILIRGPSRGNGGDLGSPENGRGRRMGPRTFKARQALGLLASALVLIALLLPTTPAGEPLTAPSAHGPFPVGHYNTTVPQAGPGGADAPATVFYPSTTGGDSAAADTSRAPWGTIAFAPGYGASRIDYWPLLWRLAEDGFVALGVDYNLSTWPPEFPDTADMAFRVGYSLNFLMSENASAASILYGMIDGSRLVSSGHSMGGGVSVLAAAQHARFDAVLPLSPYILPPLFWPPNEPGQAVPSVFLPMQIIVGSADPTAVPALNADVLYNNGNCPKSEFTILGADHTFSDPGHQQLVGKYGSLWLHYYLERDASVFDALFGSGAQADQTAGLITYVYCLDTASIEVTPPVATVLLGSSQLFTATVRDRVGTAWPAVVIWSLTGALGSIDASGLFAATASGVGSVTAERDGVTGSALVTTGPALRPIIGRAFLSGGDLSNLTLEWWKTAADGAPGGPVSYRVLESRGDPAGPYTEIASIPAGGLGEYAFTCGACGHLPGDTEPLFFRVRSVDVANGTRDSNLAARYGRAIPSGRSLLSVPLLQADSSAARVLQTIGSDFVSARAYDAAAVADPWKSRYPGRGDLQILPFGSALWIDLTSPGQYTLAGLVIDLPSLTLRAGWNLVAYASLLPESAAASLAGIPLLRIETFAAMADPYRLRVVPASEILGWGEAYWVYVTTTATWVQG